ncbi:MAG TPA: cytochrome P450 [Solirubrobacteraceae bacterium]|nr:cytochrome P450 [Solirubrobacteraceae bacterium]
MATHPGVAPRGDLDAVELARAVTVEQLEDDPYPLYARWREEAPAVYVAVLGLWFVTRWHDAEYVTTTPEVFEAAVKPSPLDRTFGGTNILTIDGPVHKSLRNMLLPSFRPPVVERDVTPILEPLVQEQLSRLGREGNDRAELMEEYFEPISVRSLGAVLGLGEIEPDTMRRWFAQLAEGATNFEDNPDKQAVADAAATEIDETLRPIFERMLRRPDGSVISNMLQAAEGTLEERTRLIMPTLKVILLGGMQEPGHGAGSTLVGLLTHPGQWEALVEDPAGRVRAAADEGLRWIAPIGAQERHAPHGATVAGVEIPAGANVAAIIASANRDRRVWGESADEYDLFRPQQRSAAFGFGKHFCVGHHFSKVQLWVALRHLAERFPRLRLDETRPPRITGWEFRAPRNLDVLLDG